MNHNETLVALGKLQGTVEVGLGELKDGQAELLAQQKITNGKVRDLLEWRAGHAAETEGRIAAWQRQQEEFERTAAQVRILEDAAHAQAAIRKSLAEAEAKVAAREKRILAWFAAIGGVGGAITIFGIASKLFIK